MLNEMATINEHTGNLNIWWFPKEFSQSRFGEFQRSGTNSCTLISLILADKVSKETNGFHQNPTQMPTQAIPIFASAINEGNAVYNRSVGHGASGSNPKRSQNLNIPDALKTLRTQPTLKFRLTEWFFTHLQVQDFQEPFNQNVARRLSEILILGADLFQRPNPQADRRYLFAVLIADSRTVVFVFEFPANMVTFFDSHQHGRHVGAVIALSNFEHIFELAQWYINMLQNVYSSRPTLYEISFLAINADELPHPMYKKLEEESKKPAGHRSSHGK